MLLAAPPRQSPPPPFQPLTTTPGPSTTPEASRGTNKYQHNLPSSDASARGRMYKYTDRYSHCTSLLATKCPKRCAPYSTQAHLLWLWTGRITTEKPANWDNFPRSRNLAARRSLPHKTLAEQSIQGRSLFKTTASSTTKEERLAYLPFLLCCVSPFILERNLLRLDNHVAASALLWWTGLWMRERWKICTTCRNARFRGGAKP